MQQGEIPMGLAMALAQYPEAMQKFAMLNDNEKKQLISGLHSVNSKEEMQLYIKNFIAD